MLQDALATFGTAQATAATSYAGTDIIDNSINLAGQPIVPTNPDAYIGNWFVVRVAASATQNQGAPTMQFQLQTSNSSTFNQPTDVTLCQSSAFYYLTLTAGKFYAARIPAGMQRYVRAYFVVAGAAYSMNGVTTDSFIAKDIDLTIDKRKMIQ